MRRLLIEGDGRVPFCWLNFKGNVSPDPSVPLGPNTLGEYLWPVVVEPREGGGTRLGLSYLPPTELREAA